MPITDFPNVVGAVGPAKHIVDVDQSAMTEDFTDERGFVIQMIAAGNITVRTLDGDVDTALSGLTAGASVGGMVPVICTAVRMAGTTADFRVFYL